MVRIEARQQRSRLGGPNPWAAAAANAASRASLSQIELTLVAGQAWAQRKDSLATSPGPGTSGVEQISSSQRFLPSSSRMGRE